MDSSDTNQNLLPLVPTAASSYDPANSTLKPKAEDEENLDVVPAKKVWFHGPYRPQNFSLPDSIIYYILKNPSSANVWEKLIKTCKYFFAKNPVAVFPTLDYYDDEWKSFFNGAANSFDLKKVTHKIWIADQILIKYTDLYQPTYSKHINIEKRVSSIIPKLYKCDAKHIGVQYQYLSYQEFLMLASNAEIVELEHSKVGYEVDTFPPTVVPTEKLVEPLSKLKYFYYNRCQGAISSKSFAELQKLPHFSIMDEFNLMGITATFDVEAFRTYMKTNKRTVFFLSFCRNLPQEYQNRLKALVDEVIVGMSEHNYPHTLIHFDELDEEKYEKMLSVYCGD